MGWQRKIVRVNMTERTALIEPLNMDRAFQSKRLPTQQVRLHGIGAEG
jgi:hypothetical protein